MDNGGLRKTKQALEETKEGHIPDLYLNETQLIKGQPEISLSRDMPSFGGKSIALKRDDQKPHMNINRQVSTVFMEKSLRVKP
jgi:hypothetical protein